MVGGISFENQFLSRFPGGQQEGAVGDEILNFFPGIAMLIDNVLGYRQAKWLGQQVREETGWTFQFNLKGLWVNSAHANLIRVCDFTSFIGTTAFDIIQSRSYS